MTWKSVYSAKCLVKIVEKSDGYMAKCLTCPWQSDTGKLTPISQAGRDHALKKEITIDKE